MRSVAELNRGEYDQLTFSSILERIGDSRKTFFSSLLDLANTLISDLSPIAELLSLERLDLSETQVSDITKLSRLAGLTSLSLSETQVSDINALAGLTSLRSLDLAYTRVSDLSAIAEFVAMIDQWSLDDEEDVDNDDYDSNDERVGLCYEGTPIAERQPYCWLVDLRTRRRTIETINVVRAAKGLTDHYPDGYEGSNTLPSGESENSSE